MAFAGYLKQSTAVDILLGPFIDDSDGKSAETGLTIDVELSKNGQALADSESAAPSHDAAGEVDGYYNCILGTTDTGTLGILTVVAHAAGFLPVRLDYQIVTANWFDTMCSTDQLDVNTTKIEGSDPTDTIRDSVLDDATRFSGGNIDAAITSRGTADTGDAMTLAEDAIKAVSYDETTAFPLKADDAAATQIARVGADGDTLETLSDQIDGVAPASEYNTEMARITANVATETKQDIIDTNVDDIETAVGDIQGRIPAALSGGNMKADALAISTSTDAADKLEASAETMVIGTVSHDNTAASTTVFYSDDITEATADHFNGRIVLFLDGALQYQATSISDYELSVGEGKFTVVAVTEPPADNSTFIIV